tara:strand:+ start:2524 stop:3735 length:1212 start_codon:yes stop_codon:yes gene_type:complete
MDKKDFKPHMMYDPKTGKGYMAKKYADHVKMDKMGYTHDKPEMKEFHAKGMEPSSRKKAKPSSTRKSLGDIRKRADSMSIVRSKKSTASMRNKAGLGTREGMENMCCKNCGDMFGKPTKENKSCQYNAYDPKGKNWTEAKKIRITPKMQRRALASKSAQAKPKSQVTLKKAPWDKKKEQTEAFDFKVNIDGFPEMFMSGNSPGEVKTHLRKLIKQPSMIQSVDRVTKHDKKKHHRDKVNEGVKYTHAAIDKSGKVIGMASQESDAKDMARRNKGRVVKLKKPMSDKKGDMMINRPFKEGAMKRMSTGDGMNTFKKKPPEVKKANEKTSGKVDYGSDESIKIMKKKTPGEQNEQNRFNTMLLPKLQKAKAALANMKKTVMGTNPTGNQQRKKYVPGIRQNIRNK